MNTLDIDCGNSYFKYRLLPDDNAIKRASYTDSLPSLFESLPAVNRIRVCSVIQSKTLLDTCRHYFAIEPEIARVQDKFAGLNIAYPQLGVDRWLAMLAAFCKVQGASLVVDSGTTTTIDGIDSNGNHLGGYIVPGLNVLHQSLKQTDIPILNTCNQLDNSTKPTLGTSTTSCINNGCLHMTLSLIESSYQKMSCTDPIKLYCCGGNAPLLIKHLQHLQPIYDKSLVFDGLSLAMP